MKKSAIAIATMAALFATAPAQAGGTQIKYDDLNLASPEGQKVLERRIDQAARQICGMDEQRTGSRLPSRSAKQCFAKAKKSATAQMAAIVEDRRLGG